MDLPERKIYTVSEFTAHIKDLLEGEYPSVWLQGEVSNFHAAPSGHCYFTLKDARAQIRCVMFKTQRQFLRFKPEDGLDVVAWGRLSVYPPRGEYQIVVDTMEPLGLGSLTLAFEQLRSKLGEEGLFDEDKKRPMPPFPKTIGLVTSRRGAAVRDMIRIAVRRFPAINIVLSSTSVQGDRAPAEIVAALERLIRVRPDVIILGRGGGSIEDLWAFNDEAVVRAVAASPIPIVSAVGHETDFTLCDFAADLRASTPSAAAEMLVPDRRDLTERVLGLVVRLRNAVRSRVSERRRRVEDLVGRLYDPRRKIDERRMRLDELTDRLEKAVRRRLGLLRGETEALSRRLRPEYLVRKVESGRLEHEAVCGRLARTMANCLKNARASVENLGARLESLSPLAVLGRGYSIAYRAATETVVKDSKDVNIGDDLKLTLHRGELLCRVTERAPGEERRFPTDD